MQDNTLFADAISNIYVTGPLVRLELSQVELSTGKEISQQNLKVTGYVILPIDAFANAVAMQQGLIEKMLKDNEQNVSVQVANDNSEGQIVLSGKTNDLDKMTAILKENTIKNIKLPVSAPFHCSLMNKATNIMNDELNKINFIEGKNKLISNVTANEISNTNELKDLLVKQIENRVRWRESVINMINSDVDHFIEIGPGKVLSGLVKRINKEVKIYTINNQEDIEGLKI